MCTKKKSREGKNIERGLNILILNVGIKSCKFSVLGPYKFPVVTFTKEPNSLANWLWTPELILFQSLRDRNLGNSNKSINS